MAILVSERQKELLSIIYEYIKDTGYPPTFEEMRTKLNVSSNQSIVDLLQKLVSKKLIKREENTARGITILPLGYEVLNKSALAPFLGETSAGTPLEAIEINGEWQEISSEIAKLKDEVFLLKISGDSMINAGINDGDAVLVKTQKEFISGDIVLAQIEGEATVKRFVSDDTPPFVYLKPENPEHEIIPMTEKTRLTGKVISVLNKGFWKSVK